MSSIDGECDFCGKKDKTPMPSYGNHPGWGHLNIQGNSQNGAGIEYMSFGILLYICRACLVDFENMVRDYIKHEQLARDQKRLIMREIGGTNEYRTISDQV